MWTNRLSVVSFSITIISRIYKNVKKFSLCRFLFVLCYYISVSFGIDLKNFTTIGNVMEADTMSEIV